jgi:hypothetical protein
MMRALHKPLTTAIAITIIYSTAIAVLLLRCPAALRKRTSIVFSKHHCTLRIRDAAVRLCKDEHH